MRTNPFPFPSALPFPHLPTRRFKRRLAATEVAPNRIGAAQWILSRPLYRFRRFELKGVPRAQRAQALRLQIRQWSPYANPGQYIVWGQDQALVWSWDAGQIENELAAQKLKPASTRVIPESLLHPPLEDGLRLIACLDGVEGQIWQGNRPLHSRWWPELPGIAEWQNFQRDAGIQPRSDGGVPAPQAPAWLKQPWAKAAGTGDGENRALPHEGLLIGAVFLLLAGFTTGYGIQIIKTSQATEQLETRLAETSASARPNLEARGQALDALARIEQLMAADPHPAQLFLMAEVARLLPGEGAHLKEWDYQNGRLKLGIALPGKLTSSFLVKKFQDAGWFGNVQAVPGSDPATLTLTMETLPKSEIGQQAKETEAKGKEETGPNKSGPKS